MKCLSFDVSVILWFLDVLSWFWRNAENYTSRSVLHSHCHNTVVYCLILLKFGTIMIHIISNNVCYIKGHLPLFYFSEINYFCIISTFSFFGPIFFLPLQSLQRDLAEILLADSLGQYFNRIKSFFKYLF